MTLRSWLRTLFGRKARPVVTRAPRRPRAHLTLEILEDRLAPATLTVNSTADNTTADNSLTLRESVLLVDAGGNATAALGRSLTAGEAGQIKGTFGSNDTIQFDPGLAGQTIALTTVGDGSAGPSALPACSAISTSSEPSATALERKLT